MSVFKLFLLVGLSVAAIALGGLYLQNGDSRENPWLKVVIEDPEYGYSNYSAEREDGIGMLKMKMKLIPNIEESKESFLLAYKAEIALNPQALKLKETKHDSDDSLGFLYERYSVDFLISLLDEDGFCLETNFIVREDDKFSYTCPFYDLTPDGKSQTEQAVITSWEISPFLAKRIKQVSIDPYLTKYEKES